MDTVTFFDRLADALKHNPPYPADTGMLKTRKRLGIEPGRDFDPDKVDPDVARSMNKAAQKVFALLGTAQYDMKTVS